MKKDQSLAELNLQTKMSQWHISLIHPIKGFLKLEVASLCEHSLGGIVVAPHDTNIAGVAACLKHGNESFAHAIYNASATEFAYNPTLCLKRLLLGENTSRNVEERRKLKGMRTFSSPASATRSD